MKPTTFAFALLALTLGVLLTSPVRAEGGAGAPPAVTQAELTEAQVQGYIAMQRDLQPMTADPKLQPDYEAIAKRHGFASVDEYSLVADSIMLVMSGLDEKGVFTDPKAAIEREIAEVAVDKDMTAADKTKALNELTEALKMLIPIKFPKNIEIVRKYQAAIEKVK
jgi:hypothetical protein